MAVSVNLQNDEKAPIKVVHMALFLYRMFKQKAVFLKVLWNHFMALSEKMINV